MKMNIDSDYIYPHLVLSFLVCNANEKCINTGEYLYCCKSIYTRTPDVPKGNSDSITDEVIFFLRGETQEIVQSMVSIQPYYKDFH
jgi:hypothetical protein